MPSAKRLLRLVDGIGLAKILEDPGRGIDDDVVAAVVHPALLRCRLAADDRRAAE